MQDKNPQSTFGPDLNEFSQNVDFSKLATNSDFIYLRASGSGSGKFREDKKFLEFAKQCRSYGIPCGAYHYALPSKDLTTADSQCNDFIEVLQKGFGKGNYGDLFPVVDVEAPTDKSISTANLIAWVDRFRKCFEKKTRRRLMLYTGLFFIELYDNFKVQGKGYPLKDMPLWIAMYKRVPSNPPVPPNIGGWTKWNLWQYTDEGKLTGVGNPLDLNWGPNSVAYLTQPTAVRNLFATQDAHNIYVYWTSNPEPDITGYNIFVNSNYAGTAPSNATKFTISKRKFSLPKGKPISITMEAFDAIGDFSQIRSEYELD